MKFDFYVTLPSNSSKNFYPDNNTSHYITRLPREWRLNGEWVVGLSEIQFPLTFSHIPEHSDEGLIRFITRSIDQSDHVVSDHFAIKTGFYSNIENLINEINNSGIGTHFKFSIDAGGHCLVTRKCTEKCDGYRHGFVLSKILSEILGFESNDNGYEVIGELRSHYPASLANGIPNAMYVLSDISEAHITGDFQTPLLRVVPVEIDRYQYGCMRLQTFPHPKYIPLLKTTFDTIEILIKDEKGNDLSFNRGTLTVTLHFKRID